MHLRQAEHVGFIHDDGVGSRYINTGFNNRGTQQQVVTLVVEITHYVFQFALA